MSAKVKSKSYTLYGSNDAWLGQVVLTEDGFFASVTDWGNFSYAWRSFGSTDFREFICKLNTGYFSTKMATGMAYVVQSKKIDKSCDVFSQKILPALQEVLKKELENNISWD